MTSKLALAAATTLMLAGGLAGSAFAQDADAPKGEKLERVIMIRSHGDGTAPADADRQVQIFHLDGDSPPMKDGQAIRTFRVERDGSGLEALGNCEGGQRTMVNEDSDGPKQKTRIVLCDKGNISPAQRVASLEQVIGRIQSDEHLSAEHKAKVTTALREAIDKLRAAP
jgi:hypothetical protein